MNNLEHSNGNQLAIERKAYHIFPNKFKFEHSNGSLYICNAKCDAFWVEDPIRVLHNLSP